MNKPIRILHVIGIMNRGGAETLIMNLYRTIDRSRVQFDFVENTDQEAAYDEEIRHLGGRIYHCPHYNGWNHPEYVKWWHVFFRNEGKDYTIIHGHIGSTASIYLRIAKKHGLYTIAHSHSSGTDYSIKSFLYKIASYNTRNIADYFFACSEAAGRDRYGSRVVGSDHYSILHNAIDTRQFCYDPGVRELVRKEMGLKNAFIVGHIGRFEKPKNHTFLLSIFQKILERKPDSVLMLVGDGSLRHTTEELANRLHIRERIIFTGVRDDVDRLLQAMDLFLFPSLYEGLPLTLVEAQATGIPCVISDRVPSESILLKDSISVCPLELSPEQWAEQCIISAQRKRTDRSHEVAVAGYDIAETVRTLEAFYFERYGQA